MKDKTTTADPLNSRWWRRSERERTCAACGRKDDCYVFQGKGTSPCGYNCLCKRCLVRLVGGKDQRAVTRRNFLKELSLVMIGLCLGGLGGYHYLRWRYQTKRVTIVTNREKELLAQWALKRAENVSPLIIKQMVEAACESEFPRLVMAIIGAETKPKFDPGSVSSAGCWGPMQVHPPTWEATLIEKGIISSGRDLFDPTLGVRAGIYAFCHYLEEARGNLKKATWSYVGAIHNKKDAEVYFDCIQRYLGEIYLALYREGRGKDNKQLSEGSGEVKK